MKQIFPVNRLLKLLFYKTAIILFLVLITESCFSVQQIQVGSVTNGVATLRMDDATLNTKFASVLKGVTLSNAVVQTATDSEGVFYYLIANGLKNGQSSGKITFVLEEKKDGILSFSTENGCVMECFTRFPCTSCEQVITTRCKTQTCKCKEDAGGTTSRIIFPGD